MKNRKLRKRLILFAGMLSLMGKPDMRVEALKKWDCNLDDQGDENKVGETEPDGYEKEPKQDETTGTNIGKYVGGTIFLLLAAGVIGRAFWKKSQGKEKENQLVTTKTEDVKVEDANGKLILAQDDKKIEDSNQNKNLQDESLNEKNGDNTDINTNLIQPGINTEKKEEEKSKRDNSLQNQSKEQNQEDLEKQEKAKKKQKKQKNEKAVETLSTIATKNLKRKLLSRLKTNQEAIKRKGEEDKERREREEREKREKEEKERDEQEQAKKEQEEQTKKQNRQELLKLCQQVLKEGKAAKVEFKYGHDCDKPGIIQWNQENKARECLVKNILRRTFIDWEVDVRKMKEKIEIEVERKREGLVLWSKLWIQNDNYEKILSRLREDLA